MGITILLLLNLKPLQCRYQELTIPTLKIPPVRITARHVFAEGSWSNLTLVGQISTLVQDSTPSNVTPHIREFGEICFAHELRAKSSFENAKGRQARILGQDEAITGYIVRYEDPGAVGHSRDIRTASGIPLETSLKVAIPKQPLKQVDQAVLPLPLPPTITITPPEPVVVPTQQQETHIETGEHEIGEQDPEQVQNEPSVNPRPIKARLRVPTPSRRSPRLDSASNNASHEDSARSTFLAAESALILSITTVEVPSRSYASSGREALVCCGSSRA